MGCYGSVMLYQEGDDYCQRCPLRVECAIAVQHNRVVLEEALGKPVFDPQKEFWKRTRLVSNARHSMAREQSTPQPKPAAETTPAPAPKPAPAVTPVPKTPAVSAVAGQKLSPADAAQLPDLRKKVQEELVRWGIKSVDPSLLDHQVNPFATVAGTKFAEYVCEVYLAKGKLSKGAYRDEIAALQAAKGEEPWSIASLQSNINIVSGALAACGYPITE